MVIKYITLYYDINEKNNGEYYPVTTFVKGHISILVGFKFTDSCWQQVTGDRPIDGFENDERNNLLKLLNDDTFKAKNILDLLGYLI